MLVELTEILVENERFKILIINLQDFWLNLAKSGWNWNNQHLEDLTRNLNCSFSTRIPVNSTKHIFPFILIFYIENYDLKSFVWSIFVWNSIRYFILS